MGYDLFRRDNRVEPRSFSPPKCFRFDAYGMAFLRWVLALVGVTSAPFVPRTSEDDGSRASTLVSFHKLCTNEGWWVTPQECAALASALDALVAQTNARIQPTPR
jgi:hypothetical protein